MPKIPTYNRRQFQSQYVGGPQVDKSGEVLAEGVAKAAGTVMKVEADKLHKKQQQIIDSQADNAVVKYSLAFQQNAKALQDQYADRPLEYANAVSEMGGKLAEQMGQSIGDERVRSRFLGGTSTMIKASSLSAVNWGYAKQDENALIAAKDTVRIAKIQTSQILDVKGYKANYAATLEEIKKVPNFSPDDEAKFVREEAPGILETHMRYRLAADSKGLEEDLKGDTYDKIPGFSGEMRNKFKALIVSKRAEERRIIKEAQTNNFDDAMDKFNRNELTFADIRALSKTEEPMDGLKDSQVNFLNKSLSGKVISEASGLAKTDKDARGFKELIDNFSDDRLDRAEKLEKILEVFADGEMLPEEEKQIREMLKPLQDAKTMLRNESIKAKMKSVLDRTTYTGGIVSSVNAVRSFLSYMREGKDPDESARLVVSKAEADKVIADNPALASSEDPVEDAYKAQTMKFLNDNGIPPTQENLRIGIEALKHEDGK